MGGRKDLITAGLTLGALAGAEAKAKGKMSAIIATESGSAVSFTAADAAPVIDLTAAIVPVQSGSGDPSPENIRPISGWTECKVTRAGKNLLDPAAKRVTTNNIRYYYGNRRLFKAGTYTMSASVMMSGLYVVSDKGTVASKYGATSLTFTITEDRLLDFNYYSASAISDDVETQLELGSAATAYEPYRGDTYTVTFGSAGTVYGGTLDVTTGTLTVDKACVDLGTISWIRHATYSELFTGSQLDPMAKYVSGAGTVRHICSIYKSETSNTVIDVDYSVAISGNGKLVYVHDSSYSTPEEFTAAMSGVQLVYELNVPIVYQLTPVEIRTLAGQNTIWADTGDVTVKYTADTKAFIDKYIAERRNG